MTQILIFLVPIIAAALVTPVSWRVLHSFYAGPVPSDVASIPDPVQRTALKAIHGFGTWFAFWMLGILVLSGIISLLGAFVAPVLIALGFCALLFRNRPSLFWPLLVLGTIVLEALFIYLGQETQLDLTLQGYSVLGQLVNPYYLNPFFIIAVLATSLLSLAAAVKRDEPPKGGEHILPTSLPDPTPPQ